MISSFEVVVDYRHYRLRDTRAEPTESDLRHMFKMKTSVEGLFPTMGTFDGVQPIEILNFLATFVESMNILALSEGVVVRLLAFSLEDDAKDAYQAQVSPGTQVGSLMQDTWPYVIHSLLERFLPCLLYTSPSPRDA